MTALTCKTCEKVYHRSPSVAKTSNYCCNSCRAKSMGKVFLKNLSGKTFSRWTVLRQATNGKSGDVRWLCRCSCGTERVIFGNSLRSGRSRSCGCYHKEISAKQAKRLFSKPIEPGTRFTRLTVLAKDNKPSGSRGVFYICHCDCGKITSVMSGDLRDGNTKSCGCYQKDRASETSTTHGLSGKPGFSRWRHQVRRDLDAEWTIEMTNAILELQKSCVVCHSKKSLSIDHVKPFSKGFGLKPGNAAVLCKSCNSTKHDKMPKDLPDSWRIPIEKAAEEFAAYWQQINC